MNTLAQCDPKLVHKHFLKISDKHVSRDKLPVLDNFRFRHTPFSVAILSKEYIMRTTITK